MDPVSAIVSLASTILNKLWGNKDDELKRQFILELQQKVGELDIAKRQIDVNVEEAKSSNLFVAGWRPFVGWVCGLSFAWTFLFQPFLTYLVIVSGHEVPNLPQLDMSQIMTLLMGMLGMAGLRTYEKIKK